MAVHADGYVLLPRNLDQIRSALSLAASSGRRVVVRGLGRSYGDAAILPEAVVLDMSRLNRILQWDPGSGTLDVEGGATLEQVWKHTLPSGWWVPVVSGTMFVTVGGALAVNVHGKNHRQAGSLAEHVEEIDLLLADGSVRTVGARDPLFRAVVGSAGLLGIIVRARLRLKKVTSGDVRVLAVSCRNWSEQLEVFARYEDRCDYLVSWVDLFAAGRSSGRGLIHAAWYVDRDDPASLTLEHQELPPRILGIFPKSQVWRLLKPFNNRLGMRLINAVRYRSGRWFGNGKEVVQSLAAFSFLLDYIPDWRLSYLPDGFIQYQCFVPREKAHSTFERLVELQHEAGIVSFLGVLKRHRPDPFLLTWALDGYSLAMDFKVRASERESLTRLCHRMNDVVLDAGGRFYFAKDSTLRPEDVVRYLGEDVLKRFREIKDELDPAGLFGTSLGDRLELSRDRC